VLSYLKTINPSLSLRPPFIGRYVGVGNQFYLGAGVLVSVWNPQGTNRIANFQFGNTGPTVTSNTAASLAYTVGNRGKGAGEIDHACGVIWWASFFFFIFLLGVIIKQ